MVPVYGSQLDEQKYNDTSNVHACESVLKVLKELLFKLRPVREADTLELSREPSAEFTRSRLLSSPMHFIR